MEEQLSGQISLFPEDTTGYDKFTEKFKPKKTTDDCYTPEVIYDAIADWVAREYGLNRANFVRPFYPGGITSTTGTVPRAWSWTIPHFPSCRK